MSPGDAGDAGERLVGLLGGLVALSAAMSKVLSLQRTPGRMYPITSAAAEALRDTVGSICCKGI
jgi:hypothetical protein